jgi:hypothetical protein
VEPAKYEAASARQSIVLAKHLLQTLVSSGD